MLHVCSLEHLAETVKKNAATHVVTLIAPGYEVPTPDGIGAGNHLILGVHDVVSPIGGQIAPSEAHVEQLVRFVYRWARKTPLVVHCFAGRSRSTAAAYVTVCALNHEWDEFAIASALRRASPTAAPNRRFIAAADYVLKRSGRMVAAIESMEPATKEPTLPFRLDADSITEDAKANVSG